MSKHRKCPFYDCLDHFYVLFLRIEKIIFLFCLDFLANYLNKILASSRKSRYICFKN